MYRIIVQKYDQTIGGNPKIEDLYSQDVVDLDIKEVICAVNKLQVVPIEPIQQ